MHHETMHPSGSISEKNRTILGAIIFLTALLLLVGGWTIPFQFESFSILYKFGTEKTFLRSGKLVGITIALLIFFQMVLASRLIYLEQIYSPKRVISLHRFNGMAVSILSILHPLLIKASEKFTPYTFEQKYFPEFVGIGMLLVIVALFFTAVFRVFLRISYTKWLLLHRLSATAVLLILPIHILYVSETFKSGVPRNAALILFSLNLVMLLRVWLRRLSQLKR